MATAFMAANTLHSPQAVFFLGINTTDNIDFLNPLALIHLALTMKYFLLIAGDIFDEGKWANQKQYEDYVERFTKMFPTNNPYVLVGNHDVGFHYM